MVRRAGPVSTVSTHSTPGHSVSPTRSLEVGAGGSKTRKYHIGPVSPEHGDSVNSVTPGVHSDTSDHAVNKSGKLDTLHDIRCTTQFSFTFSEGNFTNNTIQQQLSNFVFQI